MPEASTARPALDKKKSIILGILWVAVIVFIFLRVIPQVGSSYKEAVAALESMSAGAVACIVLSLLVYLLVYGLPFMAATPGLPYGRSQQLNQAAYVITKCVPGGGAFGLGIQYEMLASYGVGPTRSTAALTAVGVWSVFVTLGLLVLGVAAIQLSGHAPSAYFWPAVVGVLALAVAILAFGFFVRSEDAARRIGSIGNRIAAPFVRRFRKGRNIDLVSAAVKLRAGIADIVPRRWLAITGAQTSVSITQFLIFYMSLRGVEGWGAAGRSEE